jgi:quercetin dioxygenase-like cupin family protein
MRVSTDHGEQELKPGQVMVIGPNIRHDLRALQLSRVLMTFCYEKWGQEPCEVPEQGH